MTGKKDTVTSRVAAEILEVTPRTIQLWADAGVLASWRTPGGHRRFSLEAVEELARSIRDGSAPVVKDGNNASSDGSSSSGAQSGSELPLRILVVEDELALLRLYEINVNNWELPVDLKTATDGYQGLLQIGAFQPHLLILDLNLPNIDGFSVINSLREQGITRQLTLFAVTALHPDEVKSRLGSTNDFILLPKPIPFDMIRAAAQSLVNQFRKDNT